MLMQFILGDIHGLTDASDGWTWSDKVNKIIWRR